MKELKISRVLAMVLLVTITVGCDQIAKVAVRNNVLDHEYIQVVNDNVVITKVENSGAALSLGENLPPIIKIVVLQILPGLVLVYLFWVLIVRNSMANLLSVGLALIIGGGIGNIFDRIRFGSVTDFMFLKLGIFKTGIFNIADVAVVIGALLIILQVTAIERRKKIASIEEK